LPEMFDPKRDLRELVEKYRRYVSLSTYDFGNEGRYDPPFDVEMYKFAKQLDPSRLVIHQDGGTNTPENSDFGKGVDVKHEYMNLAIEEDPRLQDRYTGAIRPPQSMQSFLDRANESGIPRDLALGCIDAGQRLQTYYQKTGMEAARLDPNCVGCVYWTIVDVGSPSAQGLLDQFWNIKKTRPEDLIGCNNADPLLAVLDRSPNIAMAGEQLKI